MSTDLRNDSYCSLFLTAASFTILLNVSLSNVHKTPSSLALIVAALGALYNRASSPKESPGKYSFTFTGS
jgi:hypothetical protein